MICVQYCAPVCTITASHGYASMYYFFIQLYMWSLCGVVLQSVRQGIYKVFPDVFLLYLSSLLKMFNYCWFQQTVGRCYNLVPCIQQLCLLKL